MRINCGGIMKDLLFKIQYKCLIVLRFALFAWAVVVVNPSWVNAYQAGDFWEYGWDASKTISDRDGTRTTRDSGSFTVVLGCPRQIGGITAYEVFVTGDSTPDTSSSWDFAPRCPFKAFGRRFSKVARRVKRI